MFFSSSFSATQEISFRHDAYELSYIIDDRKAADPVPHHKLSRIEY